MYKIQLLLFICVLLASASGSSGGLIACYEFENDVRDSSGNGYDGIIGGAPEFVSGYSGKALRFDGANDYVDLSAHHAVLSSLGDFTLSMWAEGYDGTTNKVLFCWTDGTVKQRVQIHGGSGGRIGWLAVNSTGSYPAWLEAWTWTPGTWYHLAFVNDTTEGRKIYVNGVEMAISGGNTPASPSDLMGATFVRIANRAGSTASWLGGIDEVRIYDKALSGGEILYLAGTAAMDMR
jgi:sialidase-1